MNFLRYIDKKFLKNKDQMSYEDDINDDINVKDLDKFHYASESQKIVYSSKGHCNKTRLEEIIDFIKKNEFKKIGLAFCSGLYKEASILTDILESHGFEVCAVVCKNGNMPKALALSNIDDIVREKNREIMDNPIGQAKILNDLNTDFNIILGLCIGHDSLFMKYSKALVTVFAVKDKVLAHNPLGAIYLAEGYFHDKLYKK